MNEITKSGQLKLVKVESEDHPVAAYLAGLSEGSRRGQLTALRAAVAAITNRETSEVDSAEVPTWTWHELTAAHMAAIRSRLEERHSPAYANKVLSAVRGVLKSAWRLKLMAQEDYARAIDIQPVRGESLPAGRDLAPGEIALLMRACSEDMTPAGVRDAALIGLGVTCGYRIAEAAALDIDDYDYETGRIVVKGKGRKERTVFTANGAKDALDDWIEIRGKDPGPLFVRIRKGGELTGGRISTTSLGRMLKKRQAQAELESFSWHDMRRTTAGDLLDVGVDLVTVQKVLGHASPTTTARYDRRPEAVKQAAIAKLQVPYKRRRLFGKHQA